MMNSYAQSLDSSYNSAHERGYNSAHSAQKIHLVVNTPDVAATEENKPSNAFWSRGKWAILALTIVAIGAVGAITSPTSFMQAALPEITKPTIVTTFNKNDEKSFSLLPPLPIL